MPHAIRVYEFGGPEVLRWEPVEPQPPGPGEALVRHTAIGLNFLDVYERTGALREVRRAHLGLEGRRTVGSTVLLP